MSESMSTPSVNARRRLSPARLGAMALILIVAMGIFSITIVESGQAAVMTRTGSEQVRVIATPGVYLRIPFIERVWLIDTRLQTTEQQTLQSCATADKQSLRLSGWMAWRVVDPARFQATAAMGQAALDEKLRKILGETLTEWVATQSAARVLKNQFPDADQASRQSGQSTTGLAPLNDRLDPLGVQAVQTGLRQVEPAESVTEAIYARMSADKTGAVRQVIAGLAADEQALLALQKRQQGMVLDEAYQSAQRTRQRAEQQLLTRLNRQYGAGNDFADTLKNPPRRTEAPRVERREPPNE